MKIRITLTHREAAALLADTPEAIAAAFPRGGYQGALSGARKIIACALHWRRVHVADAQERRRMAQDGTP